MKLYLIFLVLISFAFSFSILNYENNVDIQTNGDIIIKEKINFDMDKPYSEGFRSIRKDEFDSIDDIILDNVTLNNEIISSSLYKVENGAEIVWKKVVVGQNLIEINYRIKNRVEKFDDFARLCYEHYGSKWPVSADKFVSKTTPPINASGETVHFQVYSEKNGSATIENRTIVIQIDSVPSGNYVGGCYLFDKTSVQTNRIMNGSAYEILKNERKTYGSVEVLKPEFPPYEFCCIPIFIIIAIIAYLESKNKLPKRGTENILPPSKDEPAIVAALVRNELPQKDLMAATILQLINQKVLEIIELENKGETSATLKKERTILILKKETELKSHQKALIDMIFSDKKEVDLDALADRFSKIKDTAEAKKIDEQIRKFNSEQEKIAINYNELIKSRNTRLGVIGGLGSVLLFGLCIASVAFFDIFDYIDYLNSIGNFITPITIWISLIASIPLLIYTAYHYSKQKIPEKYSIEFEKWSGFENAIRSSRLKEYPPSSIEIWGEILVYATALGLADKVKTHLSELGKFSAEDLSKINKLDTVRFASYAFYSSTTRVHNVANPAPRSSGSYSSHSSGGWSGGGGGFSGGSSGGGGFR